MLNQLVGCKRHWYLRGSFTKIRAFLFLSVLQTLYIDIHVLRAAPKAIKLGPHRGCSMLPAQPPNRRRPFPPPTFTHGISVPPGIQLPNSGPFPMMGSCGRMPNHAPFSFNKRVQVPSNISLGSGSAIMQPMFEQRNMMYLLDPGRQHRGTISPISRMGVVVTLEVTGGSFAPNAPIMNSHPALVSDYFTGSQQEAQSGLEWNHQGSQSLHHLH